MIDRDRGIWEPWRLASDAVTARTVGPLTLWMEHRGDELHVAAQRAAEGGEPAPGPEKPDDLEWRRWICGPEAPRVVLEPRLPDRAVIVRPAMPVAVLPGLSVDLFVSIPVRVAVRLCAAEGEVRRDICEEPTVLLSNSWFGLPVEGQLCYALKTRARRRLEELRAAAHLAVCPVTVRNESERDLVFERLCLPAPSLRVHAGARHLWTSRAVLGYRGEETLPPLAVEAGPPAFDGAGPSLTGPRAEPKKSMVGRVTGTVRSLAGR